MSRIESTARDRVCPSHVHRPDGAGPWRGWALLDATLKSPGITLQR
jgi:hypothetical protein